MRILCIASNKGAVNYHRIEAPHLALKIKNPSWDIRFIESEEGMFNPKFGNTDVFVFTRQIRLQTLEVGKAKIPMEKVFEGLKKAGKKIILDVDDWWVLDDDHILADRLGKDYIEQTIRSLRVASMVITTNKRLLKKIRPYNKNVYIIPNCISHHEEQWQPKKTGFKIAYFGGNTHDKDLQMLQTDVKERAVAFVPDHKKFGFKIEPMKDVYNYGNLYNDVGLSLAPLALSPFNVCKSNLKVMEAAAKKTAIAVSNVPPYTDFKHESIITLNPDEDWESVFDISEKEMKQRGNRLYEAVREVYNIDKWNEFRKKLYLS